MSQGDFYYTTTSVDEAKSLHAAIRNLANSHYRLPFGDACGDAADKIATEAEELTNCQSDSDCVYIDAYHSFEVVPPSSNEWLLTEDCTALKPPVVANKFSVAGAAQKLDDLVCGGPQHLRRGVQPERVRARLLLRRRKPPRRSRLACRTIADPSLRWALSFGGVKSRRGRKPRRFFVGIARRSLHHLPLKYFRIGLAKIGGLQ